MIGQILLGGFFLITGVNHFTKLKTMTSYARSKKVPSPRGAVILTGLMLITGGLGILLGLFLLAVPILLTFLIPTSFIMHKFWDIENKEEKREQMLFFMYNMALIGALLIII